MYSPKFWNMLHYWYFIMCAVGWKLQDYYKAAIGIKICDTLIWDKCVISFTINIYTQKNGTESINSEIF